MNITITQNNNIEWITSDIIKEMYLMAIDSNNVISYSGYLKSNFGHNNKILYLNNMFGPNLIIEAQKYYIDIEDPEVDKELSKYAGDGKGILAENAPTIKFGTLFRKNTLITEFNEFRYFTQENTNPISGSMFSGCSNLRSITLADVPSIKIESELFRGCTNLLTVVGLQNVTNIYAAAFGDCPNLSITDLNLPNLVEIRDLCFQHHSKISKITNLGKITTIPFGAFGSSNTPILSEVYIPYECTDIGSGAFDSCTNLTTIKQYTSSVDNWVSGEDPTSRVIDRVTNFGDSCFLNCTSLLLTNADIVNAITIGLLAFQGTKFSGDLNLPNLDLEDLPMGVFRDCTYLTSVSNLGTITSINKFSSWDRGAFQNCQNLVSVNLPSTVTYIGDFTFCNCTSLLSINNLENIVSIGAYAFQHHPNWDFIINFSNLTEIVDQSPFDEYRAYGNRIRLIYIPKLQSDPPSSDYLNWVYYTGGFCGITTDILYFRDILAFHPGAFTFTKITNLVINNITPPEWRNTNDELELTHWSHDKSGVMGDESLIDNIYVPDSAVSAYLNDSNWSVVASKIKPLSQLAKVATEADLQERQVALIEEYM